MPRLVRLTATGPVKIEPPLEKPVWVCACGLSQTHPICDGAHKACRAAETDPAAVYIYDDQRRRILGQHPPGAGRDEPSIGSVAAPDTALSRDLELAEAGACRAFAQRAAGIYPDLGIRIEEAAGGVAVFYAPGDPLNAVKGAGLVGPVDPRRWDAVEAIFLERASPVVVDLSPLADDGFLALLNERGYRIGSFETVLWRRLDASVAAVAPPPPGITITVAQTPEQCARWSQVVGRGFADGGEPARFAVNFGRVREGLPGGVMLLAEVDGQPVGGAGISVFGDVAHMSGAAVLPEFRGRGIQSALTGERLRIALARGCRLAKLDVRAGTVSHRNAARAGFQVAYTRPQLIRSV